MLFGCKRDKQDKRDYLMSAYLPVLKLPKRIDYTSEMTPVRDQGNEGTCVGFSSAVGMKEYQEQEDWKRYVELSPRFLYSECKRADKNKEEGTTIRTAMKVLKKIGVCQEKYWPYIAGLTGKVRPGARVDAKKNKVLAYARIADLYELKASLVQKGPCVIGVEVFRGMMEAATGMVPMPKRGEKMLGGHAICPVGYDDNTGMVKFKNSWSAKWGKNGYGFLKYEYVEKYMMDGWSTLDSVENRE